MIVFSLIRIVYLYMAAILILNLFKDKNIYNKIAYAVVAMPFFMRAFLLK